MELLEMDVGMCGRYRVCLPALLHVHVSMSGKKKTKVLDQS